MTAFPPIRQDTASFQTYSINQLSSPSLIIPQFTKAFVFPDIQRPSLPTFAGFFRILPAKFSFEISSRLCRTPPHPSVFSSFFFCFRLKFAMGWPEVRFCFCFFLVFFLQLTFFFSCVRHRCRLSHIWAQEEFGRVWRSVAE